MKTVDEILDAAADLIEPPGTWVQGAFATNKEGLLVFVSSKEAHAFCMVGALQKITGTAPSTYFPAITYLVNNLPCTGIEFNENPDRTQEEVVSKLREVAQKYRNEHAKLCEAE